MTKFANPFTPTFDLVVTRHAPLVEWLLREGYIDESTPVVEHAHADRERASIVLLGTGYEVRAGRRIIDVETHTEVNAQSVADAHNAANVRGKHVLGVLPHHLSCLAASITEVQLDWELKDRAAMQDGDLDVEAVSRAARGLHTYRVTKSDAGARPAAAFARAIVEADVCQDGVSITWVGGLLGSLVEVSDAHGHRSIQVDLHRGAMRTTTGNAVTFGPWLDPLTDKPWQVASCIHTVEGKPVNGPVRLVGGYPGDSD